MNYKRICLRAVGYCLALLIGSCDSRIPIHTSYDKSTSFEKYHTYALDLSAAKLGPNGKHTLEESLRARLAARGLKEVAGDQANLLVVCSLATEQKQIGSPVCRSNSAAWPKVATAFYAANSFLSWRANFA
jgi:hypothetical protein